MNSGLEARNSLFLIHAVTQTVFTTWTNCLVCFSIFPFLTFVSNIISVFCFELPAAFRLGRRCCEETEWKIPPQFFFFHLHSLPSWHCSSLQQVQGVWASGMVTRTCQGLWLRQEWSRNGTGTCGIHWLLQRPSASSNGPQAPCGEGKAQSCLMTL